MTGIDSIELAWGIRKSFVNYVDRLPDGVVLATGGAVREADAFRLPGRRLSSQSWAFDGVLHFFGHSGVLNVTLEAIRIDGDELSAEVAGVRIPMALLAEPIELIDSEGDAEAFRFNVVVLTDDGAAVLGGVYPANAPADPVTIHAVADLSRHTLSAPVRTP